MRKKLDQNNRIKTTTAPKEIIRFISENFDEEIKNLSRLKQLELAMKFYNCEKSRLQKGKIYIDTISHMIPWIISLLAMLLAISKS